MSSNEMILAYRAPDAADALVLVQALEAAGVPVVQNGGAGAGSFGELGADALVVELWIERDQAELARRTIEEVQGRGAGDAGAWTCEGCGEVNEGSFEVCWKCQGVRGAG